VLTKLIVRNFKRFASAEIDLGQAVVFIGPNNSGKTSALQALALWQLGVRKWSEKRRGKATPEKRSGVIINRLDVIPVPVPNAILLWRDLHVRDVKQQDGKPQTKNIRIEITVQGVNESVEWRCGLEFDYANEESFYCRPLRADEGTSPSRMPVPEQAESVRIAYLPPMSGLVADEDRLDTGSLDVRIGEGRTAEVLRNLCHQIAGNEGSSEGWKKLCDRIKVLFGVTLEAPVYVGQRGRITMSYRDQDGVRLDLSCSGRGLQQTLLLLAYPQVNPGAVLLLDEPDAHLEILRQRQIYQELTQAALEQGSQVVAASHSEILLNEAADRDVVVAFVGAPHRIDNRGSQVYKALKKIGFDQYYQAEQKGWVLYLEGSTDLAILQAFARVLNHPATAVLERPFVHYVGGKPAEAKDHFFGLYEAKKDLVGIALFDRMPDLQDQGRLVMNAWRRREIENYLALPEVLERYAVQSAAQDAMGPIFEESERIKRLEAMKQCIADLVPPIALRDRSHRWWADTKASEEFLDGLFEQFFAKLGIPNSMRKSNYHVLARLVPREAVDAEVREKLDKIVAVASNAHPLLDESE